MTRRRKEDKTTDPARWVGGGWNVSNMLVQREDPKPIKARPGDLIDQFHIDRPKMADAVL